MLTFFLKIVHFHMDHIVWIHMIASSGKIVLFSNEIGLAYYCEDVCF